MLSDVIRRAMVRDLEGFDRILESYPDEPSVWMLPAGVNNSAGTLTLHVCGNLRHYIGGIVGQSGYRRDREVEFSSRDVPRVELELLIAVTRDEISRALEHVDPEMMPRDFPVPIGKATLSLEQLLVHLATHTSYHLGQADLHRRIVTGDSRPLDLVSADRLHELSIA